ncbi:hypothetical protein C8J57DRAFT_1660976 [Mycena rebaudengoi]|nr:hypothetical protein C8J57DRAFT_1660976 [Mycena rebaudengoi]
MASFFLFHCVEGPRRQAVLKSAVACQRGSALLADVKSAKLVWPNPLWMYESEACRHEMSSEHTRRVRELSAAPGSSPFHASSPPEQNSSQPPSPAAGGQLPLFRTTPGPRLPQDDEDMIYDDWDDTWGPGMAKRNAESDAGNEAEDCETNDGWGDDEVPLLESDDDTDDPFNEFNPVVEAETRGEQFIGIGAVDEPDPFGSAVEAEEDFSENVRNDAEWWPWNNREEFANPLVRPFIHVLSEDAGEHLSEASQAEKWRLDVSPDLSGPMVRLDNQDYFVNEPALVHLGTEGAPTSEWTAVLPSRWFLRDKKIWAKVQRLRSHPTEDGLLIDNRSGQCGVFPLSNFFASFPDLEPIHQFHGLKNPSRIIGYVDSGDWEGDDLVITACAIQAPNPLREIAAGRRIHSVPLWVYCDDTFGNISKKWNKHNSILMSLAGLDAKKAHLLYNVIFLATSNLAHLLEMFDAVVEALKSAQKTGIEAYDCHFKEMVFLIPWIIAMLGDNPMQSEFAAHIGLPQAHVRKKTLSRLHEQLETYLRGAPSTAATQAMDTGVKDKYFQHFADQLREACAKIKEEQRTNSRIQGNEYLLKVLRELRQKMPADDLLFSPALRMQDFDPNSDSPVEILHVVLLGFVKYFWRDAVSRQDKDGKEILKARINSFDTSALGLAKARGNTFVQYAGSLTGRDFRLILQLAPAVLYGLIPDKAYEAWLALCRLAPMVFQPEITDLSSYLDRLQRAVDDFLAATALWNTQWFNKPKFHVLLHILRHIRKFGPAVLCATETFESYNYIIRAWSVHSNRQAPSLDIAQAFSHMHAVQHLVSGGWVLSKTEVGSSFRQAGSAVLDFVKDRLFVKLMGMSDFFAKSTAGKYTLEPHTEPVKDWSQTKASASLLNNPPPGQINNHTVIRRCSKVVLADGDIAQVDGFVVFRKTGDTLLRIGRVLEVLTNEYSGLLLGMLINEYSVGDTGTLPYRFPSLAPKLGDYVWCTLENCLATASTIHNCAAHGCTPTATRPVIQERKATGHFDQEVIHSTAPQDILLNLAQLRSARYTQTFQPVARYPDLPREALISQAVVNHREMEGPIPSNELAIHTLLTIRAGKKKRARPAAEPSASNAPLTKAPRIQSSSIHPPPPPPAPYPQPQPQLNFWPYNGPNVTRTTGLPGPLPYWLHIGQHPSTLQNIDSSYRQYQPQTHPTGITLPHNLRPEEYHTHGATGSVEDALPSGYQNTGGYQYYSSYPAPYSYDSYQR